MKYSLEKKRNQSSRSDKEAYFWNRIRPETQQRGLFILLAVLSLLPLVVFLTARGFLYGYLGPVKDAVKYYIVVGNYWFLLIESLGILTGLGLFLGMLQKKNTGFLQNQGRKAWIGTHWMVIHMALLMVWAGISTCLSKDPDYGFWGDDYYHAGFVLLILGLLFFAAASNLNVSRTRKLMEILVGACAATGILVLAGDSRLSDVFYLEDCTSLMFHHHNHYGYFLAVCTPLAMGLFLQDCNLSRLQKAGRLLEFWLILNAVAVNSTRGAFLAIAIILICWNVYVFLLRKDLRRRMIGLDLFFGAVFLVFNSESTLGEEFLTLLHNFTNLIEAPAEKRKFEMLGTGRERLWKYGLQFAMEKPLFGYGLSNLQEPYWEVGMDYYSPHNCLILLAASLGFPAAYFYLSGLTGHLLGFFKYVKNMTILDVTVYGAVGSYLISSFVGSWVYYTSPYYFLVLGLSYGVYKRHLHTDHPAS